MPGIMRPQPKQDALLEQFRQALGPTTTVPATLDQRLKGLSETELSTVMTIAQMVKMRFYAKWPATELPADYQ